MIDKLREILAKIFFCPVEDLNNVLMHIPVGIGNTLIGIGLSQAGFPEAGLGLAVIFGYGFVKYELNEQKSLGDKAYQDIKGWLWGIGILAIPLLIARL